MLVTLNRPKALNCISLEQSWELDAVWNWYDAEPELRVAIVTGSGRYVCLLRWDLFRHVIPS